MTKNLLVDEASTQSRARRPLPDGWAPQMVARSGCRETWRVGNGTKDILTWVFDQGGPILGYTSPENPLTEQHALLWNTVPYGPGSVVSKWEVDAADLLLSIVGKYAIGGGDRVRFFANGSDACEAAVRVARAYTGRADVVSIGYHGSSGTFATPPQNGGVLEATMSFNTSWEPPYPFLTKDTACIIVEVPSLDGAAYSRLAAMRRYCDEVGALLILDEVVTGFRLALGGAAELYGVKADLLCYGKAMSNGRPISALVGRAELLDQMRADAIKVFSSNTLNGDPHSCAQMIATLDYLLRNQATVYPKLWGIGESLRTQMADAGVPIVGHAPRTAIQFNGDHGDEERERDEFRREFCRRMVARGVVLDRPNYASLAHTAKDIELTALHAKAVLHEMGEYGE